MKLVRYGAIGQEKPGLIDKSGQLRDLSGHLKDLDGEAYAPSSLAKLAETTIAETKIAMSEDIATPAIQAAPEPIGAPASPEADIAATKIATLGGPAVTIATPPRAKVESTKPEADLIKKRQHARRAAQRRRLATRASAVAQLPQQPANPFGQPAPTIVRRR
jgi:hypothetical protein